MQLILLQDGVENLGDIRGEDFTHKTVGKELTQRDSAVFQQRQRQQHKEHHLQAADQLIEAAFDLLVHLLLLATGKQRQSKLGKHPLALAVQSGGLDGGEPLNTLQDKVALLGGLDLQLLGVKTVTIDSPDADQPHQSDPHTRHHGQQRAHVAHHRQCDSADDPVGTQAVIQLDFSPRRHLPVGKTAEDFARCAFIKEVQRITEQARESRHAVDHHKAFDKALGDPTHAESQRGRNDKRQQEVEVREVGFTCAGKNLIDGAADHRRHNKQR
ncbi:hypothetical protein D3C79_700130 [compost metagenome]